METTVSDIYLATAEVVFNSTNNDTMAPTMVFKSYYLILAGIIVVSLFFLLLTIAVYLVLPEFQNVHGRDALSVCSCHVVVYGLFMVDLAFRGSIPKVICQAISTVVQGGTMAGFFWMQVMAYDIYKAMTKLRNRKASLGNWKKTFRWHCYYAIGAAFMTTLPVVLLDATDWVSWTYKPRMALKRCWFSGDTAFLFYFHIPTGLILLSNLVMFVVTCWHILKWKHENQKTLDRQDEQRVKLYVKLFMAMGLTWLFLFLPWATGIYDTFILAVMVPCMDGPVLFIILVCRKRTLKQIWTKMTDFFNRWKTKNFPISRRQNAEIPTVQQQMQSATTSTNDSSHTTFFVKLEES